MKLPAAPRGVSRRAFLGLAGGTLLGIALADLFWFEPRRVTIETLPLATGRAGGTVRIVQLSDLHLDGLDGFSAAVAAAVARLAPDLIVLTGDYLEEERNLKAVLDFLRQLTAPAGIFAIQGNWEYWSRLEGENLRRHFKGAGVRLLINERVDLAVNGRQLSILGLDYPSPTDQLKYLQQDLDPQRFNLLLSHIPAFAHEQLDRQVNLVLAGHTHGGQARLPLLPPIILPRFVGRFVAGLYRVGPFNTPLYVNRGIGTSILPVRFFCPPEITLIEITT